jgi:hypothetical protein
VRRIAGHHPAAVRTPNPPRPTPGPTHATEATGTDQDAHTTSTHRRSNLSRPGGGRSPGIGEPVRPAVGSPHTRSTSAARPASADSGYPGADAVADPAVLDAVVVDPAADGAGDSGGLSFGPATTLLTAEQAGALLAVPGSWLRDKAAAREIPCRKLGKHLRFAPADLAAIAAMAARPALPTTGSPAAARPTRGPARRRHREP